MIPEQAFLEEIWDKPDDDMPRLMFADWLEEQGNPRGEFIRIQCELAKMDEDDPRRADLEARERELQSAHVRDWTGEFHPLVDRWEFRRGFVEGVTMGSHAFLRHLPSLLCHGPIRHARLTGAGALPQVARSGYLARLTRLELCGAGIQGGFGLQELIASPFLSNLEVLDLSRNGLGTVGAETLQRWWMLPKVNALSLNGCGLGVAGARLLARLPARLATLHIRDNGLGGEGLNALFGTAWTDLEEIDLGQNGIGPGGFAALSSWVLIRAQRLALAGNGLGVSGVEGLRRVFRLEEVTNLDVSDNGLGDEGLRELLSDRTIHFHFIHLPRCRRLALAGNGLTVDSVEELTVVAEKKMPRLAELDLSRNQVGTPGVEVLAGAPSLRGLRRLNLSRNHLGPAGVEALVASPHLTELTRLDLSGNGIGARGAKSLLDAPHLDRLAFLDVRNNRLDEDAVARLQSRFGARVRA